MTGNSFDETMRLIPQITSETKGKSLDELETLFVQLSKRFKEFFHTLQDLETIQPYNHPHFGTLIASYTDIVHHIVNHGTFHRGNISAMLHQLGHSSTPTDYIFYFYHLNSKTLP